MATVAVAAMPRRDPRLVPRSTRWQQRVTPERPTRCLQVKFRAFPQRGAVADAGPDAARRSCPRPYSPRNLPWSVARNRGARAAPNGGARHGRRPVSRHGTLRYAAGERQQVARRAPVVAGCDSSDGEPTTALATAGRQDGAACTRPHPQPEPMRPRASTIIRLEGALAHGSRSPGLAAIDLGTTATRQPGAFRHPEAGRPKGAAVSGRPYEGTH